MNATATPIRTIDKVVRLGTIATIPGNKPNVSIFCKIEFDGSRLTISGVEGPRPGGYASGGCGQIVMHYETAEARDAIHLAPGWTRAMLDQFFDVWGEWHLNDLQAGTPAQTAALVGETFPGYATSHYEWASEVLAAKGLNPDDGYYYGSSWLTVEVPADVLDFLASLPDTDKTPAWV